MTHNGAVELGAARGTHLEGDGATVGQVDRVADCTNRAVSECTEHTAVQLELRIRRGIGLSLFQVWFNTRASIGQAE